MHQENLDKNYLSFILVIVKKTLQIRRGFPVSHKTLTETICQLLNKKAKTMNLLNINIMLFFSFPTT